MSEVSQDQTTPILFDTPAEGVRRITLNRPEALNAFNRSTLGKPKTDVTNSLFGQITSISGNRVIQLVTRFDF